MREGAEHDRDQQHCQHCDRPAPPALLSFAGEKRKKQQRGDYEDRADEKRRSLERWRKQREHAIEPQEKVIRLRNGLDNRWIRFAGRSKRTEVERACRDRQDDKRREEYVFPNGIGKE